MLPLRPFDACQRSAKKVADSVQTLSARWHEHKRTLSFLNCDGLARRKLQRTNEVNGNDKSAIIGYFEGDDPLRIHLLPTLSDKFKTRIFGPNSESVQTDYSARLGHRQEQTGSIKPSVEGFR